jgi:hypothetical protein
MERSLKSRHTPLTLFLTQKRKHSFRKTSKIQKPERQMGMRSQRENNNTEIDKLSSPGLIFYCIVTYLQG